MKDFPKNKDNGKDGVMMSLEQKLLREKQAVTTPDFTELGMALRGMRIHRIQQIKRSMTKIMQGSYGLCDVCGCTIPRKRLRKYPEVTLCVPCQHLSERREKHDYTR